MSQLKILVVDDEVDIARALRMRLKSAGYEVVVAHDGLSATQAVLRELPDLVILDIGMPCGDGHVVAERLLSSVKFGLTPIIYLTARTSEYDRKMALSCRASAYITKPYKPEELLDAVSRALVN